MISGGHVRAVPQDSGKATYAPLLTKEMGLLNFDKPALTVYNLIRGLDPWPGAYIEEDGVILKVWSAEISSRKCPLSTECGDGAYIQFGEVQPPGGKRMPCMEYIKGNRLPARFSC
jgi:methionyl-tRNA formyltransferase